MAYYKKKTSNFLTNYKPALSGYTSHHAPPLSSASRNLQYLDDITVKVIQQTAATDHILLTSPPPPRPPPQKKRQHVRIIFCRINKNLY